MKFGRIELEQFEACKLNQQAASAWAAVENLVGCTYTPLVYCGKQTVRGVNHFFIAELSWKMSEPQRHIMLLVINEFNGKYELVKESLETIL